MGCCDRLSALLVAGSVAVGCSGPQPPSSEPASATVDPSFAAADSIVTEWVEDGRVPGAVLFVTRDGEVVHHRAYGAAQLTDYGAGQYPDGDQAYDDPSADSGEPSETPLPTRTVRGIERLAWPVPMTT